jgi:hypothetical protein
MARRPVAAAVIGCLLIPAAACTETRLVHEASGSTVPFVPTAPCEVSDLLVPSCGAWLGASTPSSDGRYDYVRGLDEYERLVGVPPAILHYYQRGPEAFPTAEQRALAERPGAPRSILYFNWKPAPDLTWRQIADGMADRSIELVAAGLEAYPHRMFLTIQHEPENDVIDRAGSGMTTTDYVDMYRHVVANLRALGVDNVVYVMGYMGFERWASIVDELYPGDDVVDWIAYDPYGFRSDDTFAEVLDKPGPDGWPGFYSWATATSPGTPIMLAEWGFNLPEQPRAADILATAPGTLRRDFPMIKALVYWNSRGSRVDARLAQGGRSADAFAAAYAEFARDPYFNATPTDPAP